MGGILIDGATVGFDVDGIGVFAICGALVMGDGGTVVVGGSVAAEDVFLDFSPVKATERPTTAKMRMRMQKKAHIVNKEGLACPAR